MELIIPLAWLAFAFVFPGIKTQTGAQKSAFWWWYPTQSLNGNNPASQRVHEGGGFRFQSIVAGVLMAAILQIMPLGSMAEAERFGAFLLVPLISIGFTFFALRGWLDLAEHQAEWMHAETQGIANYRYAEINRMLDGEYQKRSAEWIEDRWASREWASRLIVFLGSW